MRRLRVFCVMVVAIDQRNTKQRKMIKIAEKDGARGPSLRLHGIQNVEEITFLPRLDADVWIPNFSWVESIPVIFPSRDIYAWPWRFNHHHDVPCSRTKPFFGLSTGPVFQ
jgi:hypothetical protein